jgi:hypothetical protein
MSKKMIMLAMMVVAISAIILAQTNDVTTDVDLAVKRVVVDGEGQYIFSFIGNDKYADKFSEFSFKLSDTEIELVRNYVGRFGKIVNATDDFASVVSNGLKVNIVYDDPNSPDKPLLSETVLRQEAIKAGVPEYETYKD